jgi:peptidoglycan/xylan/chitin deacetylase (PgdA/CDA1 family)
MTPFPLLVATGEAKRTGRAGGEICLTFDNLPAERHYDRKERQWINERILATLKKRHIKGAGFVIGDNIEGDTAIIDRWLLDGHIVGFHPYSGQDVNEVPVGLLVDDMAKGMESLESILTEGAQKGRYFRYPFLRYGKTYEIRKAIEDFLDHENITVVHASIATEDFVYNLNADKLANSLDSMKIKELRSEYLLHLKKCVDSANALALLAMERPVKHIIQLHANRINALYLDDIIEFFQKGGYRFISLEEALEDRLYKNRDAYMEDQTVSFLERLLLSNPDQLPAIEK